MNRLRCIPWRVNVDPADVDAGLKYRLADIPVPPAESRVLSGTLNWVMQYRKSYFENGLTMPPAFVEETQEYSSEQNPIQQFCEQFLKGVHGARVKAKDLADRYKKETGETFGPRNIGEGLYRKVLKEMRRKGHDVTLKKVKPYSFVGMAWAEDEDESEELF